MKADPDAQRRLLDLQAIDTALGQLAHRRRTLPEHAEISTLEAAVRAAEDELARARVAVDDLDRDIARLERDVDQVRQRADRDRGRLDSGTGTPKELEGLQHELGSLARRQSELEDAELELMEQRETAQAALDAVAARQESARAALADAQTRRDVALADIAKEEEWRRTSRAPLAADLPPDLVRLYERIRDASGGVGAAMLRHRRCEGCHLELSGSDLGDARAAAADDVLRCEECNRILVRTAESGL